jgi:hypothetical protein
MVGETSKKFLSHLCCCVSFYPDDSKRKFGMVATVVTRLLSWSVVTDEAQSAGARRDEHGAECSMNIHRV